MNGSLNPQTILWLAGGLSAGALHGVGLYRASREPGPFTAPLGLLRLALVAGVLTAGAIAGHLPAAAGGWLAAFAPAVLVLGFRRRP